MTSKRTNIKHPTRIVKRRATTRRRLSRTKSISRRAFHEHCIAHQCRSRVTDAHLHRARASALAFARRQRLARAQPRTKTPHTTPRVARASTQPPRIPSSSFVAKPPPSTAHRTFYQEVIVITSIHLAPPPRRATTIYAPKHAMRDDDVDDDVDVLRAGFRAPTSRACAPRGTTHTECRRAPFRAPDDDADRLTEASTRW